MPQPVIFHTTRSASSYSPPVHSNFKVRLRGPRFLNFALVCYHRTNSCACQALFQTFTNLCLL